MDNIKKIGKEIIPYLVIIILVLLIKAFIFTPVIVNGPSMMTNLHDKDIMILPGEIIEYKDNKLYINDKEVEDPYPSQITGDIERQLIPENTYYVLGDNRTDSVDSRILGPIDKNKILGHATFIIYPFNRFGSR